jgi:putative transposase
MASDLPIDAKRSCVELDGKISIARQCELLGLPRASLYYEPVGESTLNLELMTKLDEQYTKTPFYGSRRMVEVLRRDGYDVNRKRVQRLMRLMGIEAIYPRPNTSRPDEQHKVYPYLLRGVNIERPNQVWATDITYIRLRGGFVYLVAVLDWFSRYVLSWELSNTLDRAFCLAALDAALAQDSPEIFNTDQGCQFTSTDFTDRLKDAGVQISMDGRGRAFDNIFTERLWRTVKYEEVYLNDYDDVADTYDHLARYWHFYNTERPHQSLGYQTPHEVHYAAMHAEAA